MRTIEAPTLDDVRAARARIEGSAIRTPLVRLNVLDAPAEIWLKLENLQPIGSFKLRGATNAMGLLTPDQLAAGVYTASAGNMAQGVAWNARRLGVPCTVVVPDHAPQTKVDAVERLGARVVRVSWDAWWKVFVDHDHPGTEGTFVHPVSDTGVMAGNGTIGLEILEDLPDVATILIPFGGGGLSCGIASAIRALKPGVRIVACEIETAAPVTASFAAGRAVPVDYAASFVDGIGAKGLLNEMWPLTQRLIDGTCVVSLAETAAAIKLMVERNRVVAEGAGGTPVAAALSGRAGAGPIVCVVSGGNIDAKKLATILGGGIP